MRRLTPQDETIMNTTNPNTNQNSSTQSPSSDKTSNSTRGPKFSLKNWILLAMVIVGAIILLMAIIKPSTSRSNLGLAESADSQGPAQADDALDNQNTDHEGTGQLHQSGTGIQRVKFSRDLAEKGLLFKPSDKASSGNTKIRQIDLVKMRESIRTRSAQRAITSEGGDGSSADRTKKAGVSASTNTDTNIATTTTSNIGNNDGNPDLEAGADGSSDVRSQKDKLGRRSFLQIKQKMRQAKLANPDKAAQEE